jgi:hypothetical protein
MTKNTSISKTEEVQQFAKKNVAILLFVVLLIVFGIFTLKTNSNKNTKKDVVIEKTVTPTPVKINLPEGWTDVTAQTEEVEAKVEKTVDFGVKPTVILLKSQIQEQNTVAYVDKIIQGAKSAISTLTYTTDKTEEKDGFYVRNLQGYYLNGDTRVNVMQRMYVKGNKVYTITASYGDATVEEEVQKVMAEIYEAKIK